MLNVFVEVDVMLELAKHYDPKDRKIKSENGTLILEVTRNKIVEVFNLNPNYTVSIKLDLYNEYEHNRYGYRKNVLARHKKDNKGGFGPKDLEPFECEEFANYFKNTYYCLNQVLARSFDARIAANLLIIVIDIQNWNSNKGFDYAAYIAEQMHTDLISLKQGNVPLVFPHYSLLMHMLLLVGQEKWKKKLKLRKKDDENNDLPVQMWTHI